MNYNTDQINALANGLTDLVCAGLAEAHKSGQAPTIGQVEQDMRELLRQIGQQALGQCLSQADSTPVFGIEKTTYLGIANNAPHPNAAKLFIKFTLTTTEGQKPWMKVGIYSAQPSMGVPEGALPFEEMMAHSWLMNPVYDWEWAAKVRDFWAISLLSAP